MPVRLTFGLAAVLIVASASRLALSMATLGSLEPLCDLRIGVREASEFSGNRCHGGLGRGVDRSLDKSAQLTVLVRGQVVARERLEGIKGHAKQSIGDSASRENGMQPGVQEAGVCEIDHGWHPGSVSLFRCREP
jgi:hypothetical protein